MQACRGRPHRQDVEERQGRLGEGLGGLHRQLKGGRLQGHPESDLRADGM